MSDSVRTPTGQRPSVTDEDVATLLIAAGFNADIAEQWTRENACAAPEVRRALESFAARASGDATRDTHVSGGNGDVASLRDAELLARIRAIMALTHNEVRQQWEESRGVAGDGIQSHAMRVYLVAEALRAAGTPEDHSPAYATPTPIREAPTWIEGELRTMWWMNHGCEQLYGDDGVRQCRHGDWSEGTMEEKAREFFAIQAQRMMQPQKRGASDE